MQLKGTLFNLHKQHQNSLLFHACMFVENISIGFIKKTWTFTNALFFIHGSNVAAL